MQNLRYVIYGTGDEMFVFCAQDHLARVHFKERIAAELPTKKPYICPFDGCDEKQYPDWQVTHL